MVAILAALAAALVAASDPAEAPPAAPAPAPESPATTPAKPEAADAVDEVQVTAGRTPVVGDIQKGVLNYRPEFFTPVRPGTAMDMVNWLPGFTFEDTRDMRGLEGSTGNVLIDGKPPTSKTDTLYAVLRRIPADQVERVDIIVGGAPGIDMHGRSMIANVILKASATAQRLFSLAEYMDAHARSWPYALLTSSEKRDGKVIEGSIEVGRNTAFGPQLGYGPWMRLDGTGAAEFTADSSLLVGGTTAVGTGLYQFPFAGGDLKVNVAGRYYHYLWGERDTVTPPPGFYSWEEKDLYDQAELGMHYERSMGRATFETQVLERLSRSTSAVNDQRPAQASLFSQAAGTQESAVRAVLHFKKDDTLNLEAFAEETFNSDHTQSSQTAGGVAQVVPVADVGVTERRGETGATLSWKPGPRLGIDATLKLESSDIVATGDAALEHSLTYWKPRGVLSWSFDKNTQVRLRVEHEVGQISFGNFATFADYASNEIRVGNPAIRPQRDWLAEAVLERSFWNGADLTLTLRRLALYDVLDVAPVSVAGGVFGEVANIGDGSETDAIANLTWPLKGLGIGDAMIKGTVTLSRPRVADPLSGQERPLSGQPELQGELHFAQNFPQWKMNWGIDAFYRGATTIYRPFGNETIAAWPHANVFVEYRPAPRLVLRAELQNLPGLHTPVIQSVFSGLRDSSPLSYVDIRRLSSGPVLYLRLRKNF